MSSRLAGRTRADEVVMNLFASRKVKGSQFEPVKNGYILNREGKVLLVSALSAFLEEPMRYKGRNVQRQNIIQMDCYNIASRLIEWASK